MILLGHLSKLKYESMNGKLDKNIFQHWCHAQVKVFEDGSSTVVM